MGCILNKFRSSQHNPGNVGDKVDEDGKKKNVEKVIPRNEGGFEYVSGLVWVPTRFDDDF